MGKLQKRKGIREGSFFTVLPMTPCYQRCILLLHHYKRLNNMRGTVEPRFTEPLYNEVLGITNDFLYPSNSKIYEKGPRYNETLL